MYFVRCDSGAPVFGSKYPSMYIVHARQTFHYYMGLSQTLAWASAQAQCADVHAIGAEQKCRLKAELHTQLAEPESEPKPRFEKGPMCLSLADYSGAPDRSNMFFSMQVNIKLGHGGARSEF